MNNQLRKLTASTKINEELKRWATNGKSVLVLVLALTMSSNLASQWRVLSEAKVGLGGCCSSLNVRFWPNPAVRKAQCTARIALRASRIIVRGT